VLNPIRFVLNPIRVALIGITAAVVLTAAPGSAAAAVNCVAGQAPAPAAVTKAETNLAATSATLQGSVNPNGCATTYHFEYGLTTAYGTTTGDLQGGSGTSFIAATAPITGLKPNTTYHFRIVATSVGGTVNGSDATFRTRPGCVAGIAPAVVTKGVAKVGPSSAIVSATVNPNGCPTKYQFQYGTTTSYGKGTSIHDAGAGTSPVSVSATLSGLATSTVYHFRIVATSAGGPADGADMAFATRAGCLHGLSRPLAVTRGATAVTQTTAILNGTVGPNGCATTFYFEYGLTTRYGKVTEHHTTAAGTGTFSVAAGITGLTPGAFYHFRLVTKSFGGVTYGSDQAFRAAVRPLSRIRIDSGRPAVVRGFFVAVHLHCTIGSPGCRGAVRLFRNGHWLGGRGFSIAPARSQVVFVKLDRRGRRLMRHHRQLRHVKIVAQSTNNAAVRFVTLVRTFRP
jgi:hypothetical protein